MRIDNIKLRPGEDEFAKLTQIASQKLHGRAYLKILKKSLDARDKDNIRWVYSIEAEKKPIREEVRAYPQVKSYPRRAIVVGSGPAGLFCAIRLIRAGIRPTVIERGGKVEERVVCNRNFFENKILNADCNVQFGEGGAGTFSDGKLNTQTKSPLNREVLEIFAEFGAPAEIVYLNKPHIGSDKLREVVVNIRKYIERNGGEMLFHTCLHDIGIRNGKLYSVFLRDVQTGEIREAEASDLVLAIGHSSRDTFSMLQLRGFAMEPREFAVGVRIEHLQEKIDFAQYSVTHKLLPPADYKLVSHAGERTAFTFCMCPGGYVIPAASENGGVVTNGMSDYARDGANANSALLVQIHRADFDCGSVLDGVEYQRRFECAAYAAGGKTYAAPVQRVEDFLRGKESVRFGDVLPTYAAGTVPYDLNRLFPSYISETLKAALTDMDKRLAGFAAPDALLTGAETRFSSPVRILRNELCESVNVRGVFPCGEGCGYSGGITSSAADGLRVAQKICEKYSE